MYMYMYTIPRVGLQVIPRVGLQVIPRVRVLSTGGGGGGGKVPSQTLQLPQSGWEINLDSHYPMLNFTVQS